MSNDKSHIILMGYMGVGKSSIGVLLAEKLGLAFIDSDHHIEINTGRTINEIFKREGEGYFRKLEYSFLNGLSKMAPSVIATGGGMPCSDAHIDIINSMGNSIYLQLDSELLAKRLWDDSAQRPLLKNLKTEEDLFVFVKKQLSEREKYYLQADYLVDANRSVKDLIKAVLKIPSFKN